MPAADVADRLDSVIEPLVAQWMTEPEQVPPEHSWSIAIAVGWVVPSGTLPHRSSSETFSFRIGKVVPATSG